MFRKSWCVALIALIGLLSLVSVASAAQPVVVAGGGFYAPGGSQPGTVPGGARLTRWFPTRET